MFSDPSPKRLDSDNNLLFKICQILSGTVVGTDSSSVSGAVADNAAETENPIPVAGKAVTSASYAPAYADGDRATLAVDKTSGGLLTHSRQLTAATDVVSAAGDIAHDAADSGSPVKIGGKAYSAANDGPTAVSDSDRVNAYFDTNGRLRVVNMGQGLITYLSAAARTSTPAAQSVQFNTVARGVTIFINVTAVTATPDLVVTLEATDPVATTVVTPLLVSASIVTTGLYRLTLYPGIAPVANVAASDVLPRTWRIKAVHGDADSITYSIYAILQM